KENMKMKKLNQIFNYKLEIFNPKKNTEKIKKLLKRLKNEFLEKINNWEKYKPIRGKIEDFFKLCKDGLNMRDIHKYTHDSVKRTVYLNVFLAGLITLQGYTTKTALQKLAEM
ncbi:hypothetical protein SAMN02910297_00918, partial [Methanobrevibacter olleyae]